MQHKKKLEKEERLEHEDSTKATDDGMHKKKERKDEGHGCIGKERVEKDLLENMEKAMEEVDSNKLVDEVMSNMEISKDQMERDERDATEVETVLEEEESEEESEEEESILRDKDDEPRTHSK